MKPRLFLLLTGLLLVTAEILAHAEFGFPGPVPVQRLIKSATLYLDKHPKEANAHYTLARIHYLAFVIDGDAVPAHVSETDPSAEPGIVGDSALCMSDVVHQPHTGLSLSELLEHARLASQQYDEAIRLDPQNGLYALGLACLLENVRHWAKAKNPGELPVELRDISLSHIRQLYAKAFTLSYPKESDSQNQPVASLPELVSYEAATALVSLSKEGNLQGPEKEAVQKATDAMAHFEKLPPGPITPIVFSFIPDTTLAQHLAPNTVVDFDLRGYGKHDHWSWVKPTLGFLVWDPAHTGRITSARQLFGNYTFQIFRANGYDALAALDDNGDGVLSGDELKGLSVWFDWNSNGVSDPGEVLTIESLPIRAIAVRADGFDGINPTNARGLVLTDGRTLRTWDWITSPVTASTPTPRFALKETSP